MRNKLTATAQQVTEANRLFHNEIAGEYDKRLELAHPLVLEYFRKLFREEIFAKLPDGQAWSVLDVGCGTGYLEQFLLDCPVTVDGIDVSDGMLKLAREKYPRQSFPQYNFRLADVYRLGEEPQRYDLVLANSFLHHCRDYEQVLEILGRKVKPGGVLFLGMEPNRFFYRYLFFLVKIFRRLSSGKKPSQPSAGLREELAEYHFYYGSGFSPRELRERLAALGFKGIKIFYTGRHTLARILDDTGVNLFPLVPNFLLDHLGLFCPLFHLVAYKD